MASICNNILTMIISIIVVLLYLYRFCRRQANPQCFRDIQETEGRHFRTCNQILQAFGDDNLTSNATNMFCQQHCPSYLIFLAERLDRDCDFPDALV